MHLKPSIFLIILMLSVSCYHSPSTKEAHSDMEIEVASAQSNMLRSRKTYIGKISANFSAVVQPRTTGFLAEKHYDNGMPVKQGEVIFRLDGKQQRANLLSAQAALESAKAQSIEARNNYERAVPLAEIDAISKAQLDQYTAQYIAAEASVKSAQQALRNARLELGYTEIQSTINGIISTSNAHIGDYVGPGTQFSVLTTIENIDTIGVDLAIPMKEYLSLTNRKSFTYENDSLLYNIKLYLADGELYPYDGFYNFTKTAVTDSMGTIIIVVSFPNPDYLLKSGQFARVITDVGVAKETITVPQSCITQTQDIASLWIIRPDSTAEYRKVTLGDTIDNRIIITSGVEVGEEVAVGGGMKLRNGMKVIPVRSAAYE